MSALLGKNKNRKEEKEKAVSQEKSEKAVKKTVSDLEVRSYQIIKEPSVTEKAIDLNKNNQYVFKVYPSANKTEIKKAVELLYKVTVTKVRTIHMPPKRRRLGRREGWQKGLKRGYRKAVVTLKGGDKIETIPE